MKKCRFLMYFDNEIAYDIIVDSIAKIHMLSIYAGTTLASEASDKKIFEPGFFIIQKRIEFKFCKVDNHWSVTIESE